MQRRPFGEKLNDIGEGLEEIGGCGGVRRVGSRLQGAGVVARKVRCERRRRVRVVRVLERLWRVRDGVVMIHPLAQERLLFKMQAERRR